MNIIIDIIGPVPVCEQIVTQIEDAILGGKVAPGAALPRIRQLAQNLEINPNTLAKANQILEERRVVVTAGRQRNLRPPRGSGSCSQARRATCSDDRCERP